MTRIKQEFLKIVDDEIMEPLTKRLNTTVPLQSRYLTGEMRRRTRFRYRKASKTIIGEVNVDYAKRVDDRFGYGKDGRTLRQIIQAELKKEL